MCHNSDINADYQPISVKYMHIIFVKNTHKKKLYYTMRRRFLSAMRGYVMFLIILYSAKS